jgi:hypothetical protein
MLDESRLKERAQGLGRCGPLKVEGILLAAIEDEKTIRSYQMA